MKINKQGKVIIIAGPSGAGESSVTHGVLKELKNTLRMITTTNRKPRKNEKNGRDYFFVTTKQFNTMVKNGDFLEYTDFFKNRNNYYGTQKDWIEKQLNNGINLIGNLELIGAKFYKKNYNALTIFVKPENFSEIKKRLLNREPNIDPKILEKRLENARIEMKDEKYYDHSIINYEGKLEQTIEKTLKIIKKYL